MHWLLLNITQPLSRPVLTWVNLAQTKTITFDDKNDTATLTYGESTNYYIKDPADIAKLKTYLQSHTL